MLLVCSVMRGFYPNNWRLSPVCDRPDWTTSPARALLAFLPPIQLLDVMSAGPQVTLTPDFFKPISGALAKHWRSGLAAQLKECGVFINGVIPKDLG